MNCDQRKELIDGELDFILTDDIKKPELIMATLVEEFLTEKRWRMYNDNEYQNLFTKL